jgi:endonuclease/exonuclease/phosphatase family metal-dependent hydrolase
VGLTERIEDDADVADVADLADLATVARAEDIAELRASRDGRVATRTLRVMTYNILSGGWPRIDALEAVMRTARADLIGLQEVEPRTLEALASRLGMFSALSPSRHGSTVGLLSHWPLRAVNPHGDSPLHNALLEAEIEPEGAAPLRIFVAHLAASYAAWRAGEGERLRELAYILRQMRARADQPHLLMGDFNSLPPDERLLASQLLLHAARIDARRDQGDELPGHPGVAKVLPRPLRPLADALLAAASLPALARASDAVAAAYTPREVVRATRAAGYIDLYTVGRPDPRTREMSCPTECPAGRIDYIFASPALASGLVACDLLADTDGCPVTRASDHRPMLATLALPHPPLLAGEGARG